MAVEKEISGMIYECSHLSQRSLSMGISSASVDRKVGNSKIPWMNLLFFRSPTERCKIVRIRKQSENVHPKEGSTKRNKCREVNCPTETELA